MVKGKLSAMEIIKKIEESGKDIKNYSVKKLGLFGSFVKNKQHKNSDIDIIVSFNKETFDNYMDLLFLLERLFKRKIDLVIEKDLRRELRYVKNEARYARL